MKLIDVFAKSGIEFHPSKWGFRVSLPLEMLTQEVVKQIMESVPDIENEVWRRGFTVDPRGSVARCVRTCIAAGCRKEAEELRQTWHRCQRLMLPRSAGAMRRLPRGHDDGHHPDTAMRRAGLHTLLDVEIFSALRVLAVYESIEPKLIRATECQKKQKSGKPSARPTTGGLARKTPTTRTGSGSPNIAASSEESTAAPQRLAS